MKLIKDSGINIRALSLADTKDFGILRIIVNDTDKTCEVLRSAGYAVTVTEVVAITIPDSPGQLSRVLDILGGEGVISKKVEAQLKSGDYRLRKLCLKDGGPSPGTVLVRLEGEQAAFAEMLNNINTEEDYRQMVVKNCRGS